MTWIPGGPVRASDQERDLAISELRERYAEGRLSHDTFVRRMDAALGARDRSELAGLLADLPSPRRLATGVLASLGRRAAAARRAFSAAGRLARQVTWHPQASLPPTLIFPAGSQRRFTIGRHHACDMIVPDLTVSRWHAGLDRAADGWLLADLGSTNGTRLNGWRIREPVPVRPGDQVSFGTATFVLGMLPGGSEPRCP